MPDELQPSPQQIPTNTTEQQEQRASADAATTAKNTAASKPLPTLKKQKKVSTLANIGLKKEKDYFMENLTMLMDAGMDTGDIIREEKTPIDPDETRPDLEIRLATLGSELLRRVLPDFVERRITPEKQDDAQATLCQLIDREDGRVFWDADSQAIYDRYRALTPWPGIFAYWKNEESLLRLKLITISHQKQSPQIKHALGEVFEIGDAIGVQTATGVIILEEVQLEGKERTDIKAFVNGYKNFIGSSLQ